MLHPEGLTGAEMIIPKRPAFCDHGATAERHRQRAIDKMSALRLAVESLDLVLRQNPNNDASFDGWAGWLIQELVGVGAAVEAMRNARGCEGEG